MSKRVENIIAKENKEIISDMEKLEGQVFSQRPNEEDAINRRIHHNPFANAILWLCYQAKNVDFITATDFRKHFRISQPRAYQILNGFVEIGILSKKYVGNLVEYWFVKNGDSPKILKYLEKAKKTLGL